MPRFDALNSLEWSQYARSAAFANRCDDAAVVALVVEVMSLGEPRGTREHAAVAAVVSWRAVAALLDQLVCWPHSDALEYGELGYACRRAYCACFTDECRVDHWHREVRRTDAYRRLLALCNELVAPFAAAAAMESLTMVET